MRRRMFDAKQGPRIATMLIGMILTAASAAAASPADGILRNVLTGDVMDAAETRGYPGRTPCPPAVLGLSPGGNAAWSTAPSAQAGTAEFVVALRRPDAVGTVLLLGRDSVSCLQPGTKLGQQGEGQWIDAPYPGSPEHTLRFVPIAAAGRTSAVRLSGPMAIGKDGRFEASVSMVRLLSGQMVNVAPLAGVTVSSVGERSKGFRPDPRVNNPAALVDGHVGSGVWSCAGRKSDISAEQPEWVVLDWPTPRKVRGCVLFMGQKDPGFTDVAIQQYTGQGKPDGRSSEQWKTIRTFKADSRDGRDVWPVFCDFDAEVETRGLRLLFTKGAPKSSKTVGLSQIAVLEDLAGRNVEELATAVGADTPGVVPIRFTLPQAGKVTVQILDEAGRTVQNLVNGQSFPAGESTVYWDLSTVEDWSPYSRPAGDVTPCRAPPATPGRYRWRGLWHPGLSLEYLYTFNPLKDYGVAWITSDRTGGWLSDHSPPRDVIRVGEHMWVGAFAEGGHALLEADTDMRKLWGSERIWLACPRIMATDGEQLYYIDQGGWVGKQMVMIQVDPRSKRSRRLLVRAIEDTKDRGSKQAANLSDRSGVVDIQGLAVVGKTAYISDRAQNVVRVVDLTGNLAAKARPFSWGAVGKTIDDEKMVELRTIPLPKPGRLRPFDAHHLAAVSGDGVVLIDTRDEKVTPLIGGLVNPLGLAVDADRRIYVGEMAPSHQVKVFSPKGKLLRTFGKSGGHPVGAFDVDRLGSPAGLDVDAKGNVWVCEFNGELKRTSVWDAEGHCIHQVIGPPMYGGGGDIDPHDANRLFYRGQEYRRDPATGTIRLVRILWRGDDKTCPAWGSFPAYPFYHDNKLFFTTWNGPFNKVSTLTLWLYDRAVGRLRPVAAMGKSKDPARAVFAWTDLNDNGRIDPGEEKTGPITYNGKPWQNLGASWQWRMNDAFQTATSSGWYKASSIAFFEVDHLTPRGYPVYRLPTKLLPAPGTHFADAVFTDRKGNAIALLSPIVAMSPAGKILWRYKSAWPGLHAGHSTTARGDEPGVLIAPTRFFGSFIANEQVGEVVVISGNLGATYLMTTDGLYVDQVWQDVRLGWLLRTSAPPTVEMANRMTLHDEHFGGTVQQVIDEKGQSSVRYVVSPGSPHCAVYQLDGVANIHRLAGGAFEVTGEQFVRQQTIRQDRVYAASAPKRYTVRRMTPRIDADGRDWPADRIDGFALACDDRNLYVLYEGRDDRAPFKNASTGDDFIEAFTKGDVLDVMLQTSPKADPQRKEAARGDIRLSFTMIDDKPAAILYDYVVPGTPASERLPFSSPWRAVYVDRVRRLTDADIRVVRKGDRVTLEAAVPLASLGLDPKRTATTRGDVGRVVSDESGTNSVDRIYWSNKDTKIMSDIPSEVQLQPRLWGTFVFEPAARP